MAVPNDTFSYSTRERKEISQQRETMTEIKLSGN